MSPYLHSIEKQMFPYFLDALVPFDLLGARASGKKHDCGWKEVINELADTHKHEIYRFGALALSHLAVGAYGAYTQTFRQVIGLVTGSLTAGLTIYLITSVFNANKDLCLKKIERDSYKYNY